MRKPSLRVYLIVIFVITVALVTTLSTAFGVSQATRGIRESVIERQRDAGLGAANNILYLFESGERSIVSTAALISASDLRNPNDDNIGPILDPLVAFSREFSAAYLLNATGHAVVARPPGQLAGSVSFAGEPAFAQATGHTAPVLTMPGAPRKPFWIVQVPAGLGTARPHFVVGILNTNLIENILFNNIERSDQAMLLNEDRLIIAATEPTLRPDTFSDWNAIQRLQRGQSLLEEGRAPSGDGEVLVTASSLRPEYPALVAMMSPRAEVTTIQAQLIRSAAFTSLGLALVTIVLGVFATNLITRPLEDVRAAARRMTGGDLRVRATPRGARELHELATDFNAMAAALSTEFEQRIQLQNSLEDKVAQRTEELDAKRQEMELFFYGVSHDFKSPVISISNIIAMVEERLGEKELDREALLDMVRRVRRSSGALSKLTNELLQFAQAERAAPKVAPVDADHILRSLIDEFRPIARDRGIRLETEGRVGTLRSDADRLRHIVANLVDNAIKYMPEKKTARVRLAWRRVRDRLEITVTDNGLGIPAEIQKGLFRPFMRHDPSGAAVSGAGLGLSIVKRMTESLKGSVHLESAPGRGSTFRVQIPIPAEGPS